MFRACSCRRRARTWAPCLPGLEDVMPFEVPVPHIPAEGPPCASWPHRDSPADVPPPLAAYVFFCAFSIPPPCHWTKGGTCSASQPQHPLCNAGNWLRISHARRMPPQSAGWSLPPAGLPGRSCASAPKAVATCLPLWSGVLPPCRGTEENAGGREQGLLGGG
ncbi:hypothetical protein H696_01359 [Fonticula alba]|uniref:Uncharacterized protein n=1 Tax=Fonticula alba TaxID=691883 RepID=A0A058ZBZ8_FONAL|nr:hypothetical protein H696_01359 [Fonticula alba]KCV71950.1 hypothetical protein H696_01359 [Fonticula alba]|eukprot:XP_009493528.1 hypothetical protein H696_01359 [Fonticula alba]